MIIAVCNQKGGVGKTTLATNLAYRLDPGKALRNLVIDGDPQGNTTTVCGVELNAKDLTLNDVLAAIATGGSGELAFQAIREAGEKWEALDVLPADRLLASRESDLTLGREARLHAAVDAIKGNYGHIVIDCPPSLGMLTTNALVAADVALIVTTAREASFDGVAEMVSTIATVRGHYNSRLTLGGIFVNGWRADRVDRREWADKLSDHYGQYLIEPFIPEREAIAAAATDHQPIDAKNTEINQAFEAIIGALKEAY